MDGRQLPAEVHNVPGVWGNMMTFWGGAHACIGFRFSLLECDLFILFPFICYNSLCREDQDEHTLVVTRPIWTKEREKGPQLPLLVSRVDAGAN
jgi:cytochrome P450